MVLKSLELDFLSIKKACYVIWFGPHKDYDKINEETVDFDTSILNYKKR